MKLLIENWKHYLNEIGDAGQTPYAFKRLGMVMPTALSNDKASYMFKTEGGYEYVVSIIQLESYGPGGGSDGESSYWEIGFKTRSEGFELTNEGKPLKVMSTIVHVVKDLLANLPEEKYPVKFTFDGALKSGEGNEKEGVRTKLYKRYIRSILGKDIEIEKMYDDPNWLTFMVEERPEVDMLKGRDNYSDVAPKITFPDAVEEIVSKVNAQLQGSGSSIKADVEGDQYGEEMYVIFRPRLKILIPDRPGVEEDELDTIPFTNAVVDSIEDFAVALYYDDYKIEAQKTPEGIEVIADFVLDEKVSSLEEAERTAEDIRYHTLSKANKIASSLVKRMAKGGMLKEAKPLSEPKKRIKIKLEPSNKNESFQDSVKRKHSKMKKRLIGGGGNEHKPEGWEKVSHKRSKSAPPGFAGA